MDDFFYFGIVFPAIAGALWGLLTYDKTKPQKRRHRRQLRDDNKPYGLPWMGGTMHPKKKDYFED